MIKVVVGLLFGFICGIIVGGSWAWGLFKGYQDNAGAAVGLALAVYASTLFIAAIIAFNE